MRDGALRSCNFTCLGGKVSGSEFQFNFRGRDTPIQPVPCGLDPVSLFPKSSRPAPTPRAENFGKTLFQKSPPLGKMAGEGFSRLMRSRPMSAHHPAMRLQSGRPFRIAFVAFTRSN